ncbi:hypothetical protein BGZ52_002568 [Haplosporangium bisporale]|nr:hypothetical protein BGZ52_002568 [Haplosporangium bisporale]
MKTYLDYLGHFVRCLALSSTNFHRHQPLTVVSTNCDFYAEVTYMVKIMMARRCRVSIQATPNLARSAWAHASQKADVEVEAMARKCLAYAAGQASAYKWDISCGEGEAPN